MRYLVLMVLWLGLLFPACVIIAQDEQDTEGADQTTEDAAEEADEEEEELTLERLFPEKSIFGPSARGAAFSTDGRYGAYLYRPRIERRHGSDLWIYDVESGEARRVTKVSVLAEFQKATREVRDDRVKKANKRGGKKKKQDDDAKDDEPAADDGLSGQWEGSLVAQGESELPPDGISFTLTVEVDDDDAVSGTLRTDLTSGTITAGGWDASTKTLTCTLTDPESGMQASLSASIKDGKLIGTLTIDEMSLTLDLTAERTVIGRGDDDDDDDDEDSDDDDTDDDGDDTDDDDTDDDGDGEVDDESDDDAESDSDAGEGKDDEDQQEEEDQEQDLGDVVDDKDADDDKAPRYGGVSSLVWSPNAARLIFVSGGDLYEFDVETDAITRLTRTRDSERAVQYLPDGSGYTYLRGSALICVSFGSHLIQQFDPQLERGETMSGYELSPDGRRVVFLATRGQSFWTQGRQVNIVSYRQRFAQVRQVSRHMPDDPWPDFFYTIYLYELDDHFTEEGQLEKIYTHKQSGPRDAMHVPSWAPDSTKVAFAVFEQTSGHVQILEAGFTEKEEEEDDDEEDGEGDSEDDAADDADDDDDDDAENGDEDDDDDDDDDAENGEGDDADDDEVEFEIADAHVVYQLFHNGGPTTPSMIHPEYLPDSRRMVFITEMSGFRQLHVLDPVYEALDQLTRGRFEVYPIDISKDHQRMFAFATKGDPAQQHVFSIDLESGEMTQLSKREGFYSGAAVSNDGEHALALHVDFGSLRELVAIDADKDEPTVLTDSHTDETRTLTEPKPEYFSFTNRHGHEIHGHMFKPDDWSADDQRPLLIYVYGGPLGTRKMVTRGSFSGANYFFAYYMTKKHGYITCTVDPRGASGYGGLFEKSNYEQVGRPQTEDLVDTAEWFIENQGVDKDRVGMHGWSFGGFQTQMCLYTEPDVFACGIAGAGPTEWYNYNTWYTTGTIGDKDKIDDAKQDEERYSLLPLAKNLKAKLLLVHGMEDSNVLYQDTVRVYRELLKAGKETLVELFLDPTGGHGLGGDVKNINRYRKYEEFLLRCLGSGESAAAESPEDVETDDEPEAKAEEGGEGEGEGDGEGEGEGEGEGDGEGEGEGEGDTGGVE